MKALSIRQPWAWLIVQGYKDVENRTWPTSYRGPILVHAGRALDPGAERARALAEAHGITLPPPAELPRGAIVGRVRIVDCVDRHPSRWFEGPYAFVLADAQPLDPVPVRGLLGLFEVDERLLERTGRVVAADAAQEERGQGGGGNGHDEGG